MPIPEWFQETFIEVDIDDRTTATQQANGGRFERNAAVVLVLPANKDAVWGCGALPGEIPVDRRLGERGDDIEAAKICVCSETAPRDRRFELIRVFRPRVDSLDVFVLIEATGGPGEPNIVPIYDVVAHTLQNVEVLARYKLQETSIAVNMSSVRLVVSLELGELL